MHPFTVKFNNHISTKMLFFIYSSVLLLTFLFQTKVITLLPHYLFVFVVGNLLLCMYLFFAHYAKPQYYVPIHIFLWMFLLYSISAYLFYSAGLIFIIATIIYTIRASIQHWAKIVYFGVVCVSILMAFTLNISFLFIVCTAYSVLMVIHSEMGGIQKWNVAIIGLLHILAILACTSASLLPYQQNTIFTLPTSFLIYVLFVGSVGIKQSFYRVLDGKSLVLLTMLVVLLGYSVASYKWVYNGENTLGLYFSMSIGLAVLVIFICLSIQKVINTQYKVVQIQLDGWFLEKWEDALGQQEQQLSWSGFDSKLAHIFQNDGVQIIYKNESIYTSGCFHTSEVIEKVEKRLYVEHVILSIHETNTHQSYTPRQYYMAYALARYVNERLNQWELVRKLKVADTKQSGNFVKELQFRKEVTYYLHDNILQNIIATKNIVAILPTEQPALQQLAVETLTDLNESIRSQMHEIYPSTLVDLSFERNIHILIDELRKRYGTIPNPHVRYEILEKMDEGTAYLFYRTLQELLANTCKYAEAKNIWIHLYTTDQWIMEMREDGKPITQEEMETKIKHLGISSLKHQASMLGGSFEWTQQENYKLFTLKLPRRTYEDTII
jgi:two-component system secretion system sensor histidine kinase SalK